MERQVARPFRVTFAGMTALVLGLGATAPAWAEFYGDAQIKRYHTAECAMKETIKPRDLKTFASEAEAGGKGFYPCTLCIPPVGKENQVSERRTLSQPVRRGAAYIGDLEQRVYHSSWCHLVKGLKTNGIRTFAHVEQADAAGYTRCTECNPPQPPARMKEAKIPADEKKSGEESVGSQEPSEQETR